MIRVIFFCLLFFSILVWVMNDYVNICSDIEWSLYYFIVLFDI